MADIKIRDTVKGTIKALDKAAIAGQKMKQAYIATKDKAEHSVNAKENTAEEYAADKTEAEIDEIAHKGAYAFNKAGRKGVQETKKNIQSAKDGIQRFKQQRAEKSINVQRAQGRTTTVGSSSAQTQTSSAIKTLKKPEKMVKQSATSAGKKNIKLVRKRRKQRRGQLRLPSIPQRQALRPVSRQQKPHRKQHKPPLRLHRKRHRQQRRQRKQLQML